MEQERGMGEMKTLPPWLKDGCYSVNMIIEPFVDRLGNHATVCTAYYKDKKNKDRECTAWVKWEDK